MTKKRKIFLGICLLFLSIGFIIVYLQSRGSRKITFEECDNAGGTVWAVDLYDPDICPACAEYRVCEQENEGASDIREACPQVIACAECLDRNSLYPDRCPGGLQKIGEISDAAIWFQCCR